MVVAGNSSRYCHNQTTDPNPGPNPNRIPNCQLSLLEMAENGSSSEWRPLGMTGRHPNQPMTPQPQALYASACWVMWLDGYSNNITSIVGKYMTLTFDLLTSKPNEFISDKSLEKIHQRIPETSQKRTQKWYFNLLDVIPVANKQQSQSTGGRLQHYTYVLSSKYIFTYVHCTASHSETKT